MTVPVLAVTRRPRSDLPAEWMVNSLHALMKLALDEVVAGRLARHDAAELIARSAVALWSPRDSGE